MTQGNSFNPQKPIDFNIYGEPANPLIPGKKHKKARLISGTGLNLILKI